MLPRLTPQIPHVSMAVALLNYKLGSNTLSTNQFHPSTDNVAIDCSPVIDASLVINPNIKLVLMRITMGAYDNYMEGLSINERAQLLTALIEQETSTNH